jgi:hypothetical protein
MLALLLMAALALRRAAGAAEPERPTEATLTMLTAAVGARVAAHAGHPFDHLPELVLARSGEVADARRAALRERLLAETPLSGSEID